MRKIYLAIAILLALLSIAIIGQVLGGAYLITSKITGEKTCNFVIRSQKDDFKVSGLGNWKIKLPFTEKTGRSSFAGRGRSALGHVC